MFLFARTLQQQVGSVCLLSRCHQCVTLTPSPEDKASVDFLHSPSPQPESCSLERAVADPLRCCRRFRVCLSHSAGPGALNLGGSLGTRSPDRVVTPPQCPPPGHCVAQETVLLLFRQPEP